MGPVIIIIIRLIHQICGSRRILHHPAMLDIEKALSITYLVTWSSSQLWDIFKEVVL